MKGKTDVHVLFSACDGCDGFEIVIGGWDNSKSMIRDKIQHPSGGYSATSTPDILSESEFRGFWISLKQENKVTNLSYLIF